jgi:hypothetical protein
LNWILSKRVLSIIAVIFIVFLTSGGIFVLIEQPASITTTSSGGTSFIITGNASSQTSSELLITFFLTIAGVAGFILIDGAFKKTFDIEGQKLKFLVGFVLILISIGLMEYLAMVKI